MVRLLTCALLVAQLWAIDARACLCDGIPLDSDELGLIIVGRVVDIEPHPEPTRRGPDEIFSFEVLARWKGPETKIAHVAAGGNTSCSSTFPMDEVFFLTASGTESPYSTGECHYKGPIEVRTSMILSLGEPDYLAEGFELPTLDEVRLRAEIADAANADAEPQARVWFELRQIGPGALPVLPDVLEIVVRDPRSMRAAQALATACRIAPRDPRFVAAASTFLESASDEQIAELYRSTVFGSPTRRPIVLDDGRRHRRPLATDAPEFAALLPTTEELLTSENESLQLLATQNLALVSPGVSIEPTGECLTPEQESRMFSLLLRASDDLVRSRAWLWIARGSPPLHDESELDLVDFAARDLSNERCSGFVVRAIAARPKASFPRLTADLVFERALELTSSSAEILSLGAVVEQWRYGGQVRFELLCEWCERAALVQGVESKSSVCPWLDDAGCAAGQGND